MSFTRDLAHEITERSWTDEARLLVDGVTDYAIFVVDPAGTVVSWNAGAERLMGYRGEEIVGQHFSRFFPAEDIERGEPARALSLAAAAGRYEEDGWRVRKDGSRFWVNTVTTPLHDERGRLLGFSRITRDRTEHKRDDDRLRAVGEVTQAILEGRDGEEVLCLIARRARELVGAALAAVATPEPGTGALVVRAADGAWAEALRGQQAPASRLGGDVLRTGRPLNLADVSVVEPVGRPGSWVAELGPVLYLPLMAHGVALGTIVVVNRKGDRIFTEADLQLVDRFAGPAAVALEYARTVGDRKRAQDRLEALAQVTQAILEGRETDEVLQLIAHQARKLAGASLATVATPDSPGDAFVVRAADGRRAEALLGMRFAAGGSIADEVFRTRRPVRVPDAAREPRAAQLTGVRGEFGPALFVPLAAGGRPTGTILVANPVAGNPLSDEDVQLVELFAAQAAVALEQARIREKLQRLVTTTNIAVDKPVEETLDALARSVVEATDTVACSVYLLDEDGGLRAAQSCGLPGGFVAAMDAGARAGACLPAWDAIKSKTSVILEGAVKRLRSDPLFLAAHDLLDSVAWDTIVSLPLIHRGKVLGALSCYYPQGHPPNETEVAFLKVVADQAASAVESARLFAAAQDKVALEERQHLARELHDSVSQALYGIALGARTAKDLLARDPAGVAKPLDYVLQLAEAGLAEMRALIFELRPESLEKEGLAMALEKHAAALRARHGITVDTTLDVEPVAPLALKQAVYRIAQEALQNTAKHAGARRVELRLERRGPQLVLEITDDGAGFDPAGAFPGHLGLRSMQERAVKLGGKLEVASALRKGTRIRATIPIEPAG